MHELPQSVVDTSLYTNPVHVLDLSVVLPGIFIVGVLILKHHALGLLLIPAILLFFILMDITIGSLVIFMQNAEAGAALPVAVVMGFLAVFSLVMLVWYLRARASFELDQAGL